MRISFIIIQSLASIWTSFWIHFSSHTHIKSSASFRHHAPVNYASSYVILTWHLFLIYLSCLYAAMFICKLKLNLLPLRYIYAFRVKWWYPRHLASLSYCRKFLYINLHTSSSWNMFDPCLYGHKHTYLKSGYHILEHLHHYSRFTPHAPRLMQWLFKLLLMHISIKVTYIYIYTMIMFPCFSFILHDSSLLSMQDCFLCTNASRHVRGQASTIFLIAYICHLRCFLYLKM